MNCLNEFLNKIKKETIKVCVAGDSLIDEYYAVKVNRVSPEFPIPVLLSEDDQPISVVPGGAANVCYQMKHWNTNVYLVTALSKSGKEIIENYDFDCSYSITMNGWKMPKKKRFYDGDFPLDRWDVETKNIEDFFTPEWSKTRKLLLARFKKMIDEVNPHIVILSDYGKGIYVGGEDENISSKMIDYCNEKSIPVMVDPKTKNASFWRGCTTLKPNADWAKSFLDTSYKSTKKWEPEVDLIRLALKCKEVVLTDSGNGVAMHNGNNFSYMPAPELSKKRPIIRSVIGAGDCFCAFFAMSKAIGFNTEESVSIAFNGASAYIEDKHNNPVTPHQFHKWFDPVRAKKVSVEQLIEIKNQTPNQTWVWTNGCFDLIHVAHLKTFEAAKALGDKVIVGLNTDKSIKCLKGDKRPILPYEQRLEMLSHLQYVDFIVPIEEEKPGNIIKQLLPNKIVKGGDYKVEDIDGYEVVGKDNVFLVPLEPGLSTSKIIERIKNA